MSVPVVPCTGAKAHHLLLTYHNQLELRRLEIECLDPIVRQSKTSRRLVPGGWYQDADVPSSVGYWFSASRIIGSVDGMNHAQGCVRVATL
jgi:hypothetical protein